MYKYFLLFLILPLITISGCVNKNIVEINLPSTSSVEHKVESSQKDKTTLNIIKHDVPVEKVKDNEIDCPLFVLPEIKQPPSLPKEIVAKKSLSDKEIIDLLVDYIAEYKKTYNENKARMNNGYSKYLESCKK